MKQADRVEAVVVEDPVVQQVWKPITQAGVSELAAQYVLASALVGLTRAGIAQRLSGQHWVPFAELVPPGGLAHLVRNTLRFLEIRRIVESRGIAWAGAQLSPDTPDGGQWRLTGRGSVLLAEVSASLLGFYVEAYGPVLARIGGLLTGEVDYGTHVVRDAEALGRRCEPMTISFLANLLRTLMRERGASSLLELGCGTGGLVMHLAQTDPDLRAVGMDIAPEPIALASRRLAQRGLGERVSFVVGDAFTPDRWPKHVADCEFLLAVGTLHEQFRSGRDAVVELLARYRDLLAAQPNRMFLLAEPELLINTEDADYYFMHVLTKQGFPQARPAWLEVIRDAGLSCERIFSQPNVEFRFACYEITAGGSS